MLEKFFTKYRPYTPIPLRITVGIALIIHAYSLIATGNIQGIYLVLALVNLFCGLSIFFGFFVRYSAMAMLIVLLAFHPRSVTHILIVAATITLIFTGSGKLSLENYFGFK